MAPTKQRRRGHDRGQVLVDMAVAIADGATTLSDVRVLGDQPGLFGDVASVPTMWRTLEATDRSALERIEAARASARVAAWAAGMDPGFYVIDIDATLVNAHSDKEGAAPNYKHGFGFQPMVAFLDATGEALAAILRPGNAAARVGRGPCERARRRVGPAAGGSNGRRGDRPDRLGRGPSRLHRRLSGSGASASSSATDSAQSWRAWSSTSLKTAGCRPFRPTGPTSVRPGRWPRSRTWWIWASGPRAPA